MAKRGGTKHIKSLAAPNSYNINRKEYKYVSRPLPGRFTLGESISLTSPIVDLHYADTNSDAAKIIKEGKIKVNGEVRKEKKYPIGINDVISIMDKDYIVFKDKYNHISFKEYKNDKLFYKVVMKYKYEGSQIYVQLNNGWVINAGEKAKDVSVGDSIVIKDKKIDEVIKLKEGAKCTIINGSHSNETCTVKKLIPGNMHIGKTVEVTSGKDTFILPEKNIIAMS